MRGCVGERFEQADLAPYIAVIDKYVQQIIDREGINHMTITTESTTQTATLDTPEGTILVLRNGDNTLADEGALAVAVANDSDEWINVRWLKGHEKGGMTQMDGHYYPEDFEVFEFQVGDRVRVINSQFEFGYEGVISSIPASNGDDCVVAVDFPHNASMSYLFDRLEKVETEDPLKAMRDALMLAFGAPVFVTEITVEDDEDDCCASYYEDEPPVDLSYEQEDFDYYDDGYDEEPLAEWEKELLYGPRFNVGDVLVLETARQDTHPEWRGLRVKVVSDEGENIIWVKPLEERPDGFGLAGFCWEREEFRTFDLASDFRVGDIVESERFGVDGKPGKAVVTKLDPTIGGDIDVDWFEGNAALLAYGPIGARRVHLTLVGVQQVEEYDDFEVEAGQEVAPEAAADLPDGTVLIVENGVLVTVYVGESA